MNFRLRTVKIHENMPLFHRLFLKTPILFSLRSTITLMNITRKILEFLGFNTYTDYTKESFIRHNIRALRSTCAIAGITALLFFLSSFFNYEYASLPVRIICLLTILFTACTYVMLGRYRKEKHTFRFFHSWILLTAILLSTFGIAISLTDCAHGGGFMVFLTTQLWIFDMLLIPPFVSIAVAGIDFAVFMTLVFILFHYPAIKFFEAIFFYITLIIINYFHYYTALKQSFEEESVIQDNEYLMTISTTDSLTDVRNRAGLEADFSSYKSSDLYVMMLDVDNFKKYNDHYGHQTGDMVLRVYAHSLLQTFGFDHVYRYGGDEFLVIRIMNSPEEFEDAIMRTKWIVSHTNLEIPDATTCSCGYVYGSCSHDDDLREMIRQADRLLYKAKNEGKDQIESDLYHPKKEK